ncbi:tubulin-binding prefolding complex subunit PAC10 [Cyberlindnera jadinii NRRL Y-1542]|uniref:Prefoldin subunit 3 n=1 Tax=Cyberlindnera jadinii (strain ATCC 18201 / CBS 1600 / BCRC 20928 / JCM 3617 / NBRC 0987 / NRRL Y-1542) TaxID=983966 RepID=A0A1E4RYH0_CYBJN|nr:Prefoldin, subunit 3 [Cyberlindnera jadinii NRRL Y-1542]ODV72329.1 Prefoldin, subunit 3 [Cyberlindnera jadinii NRRL Y-1542]
MEELLNSKVKNPRGIPQAPFVEKVDEYVKTSDDFDKVMQLFQERLQQYKYMEQSKINAQAQFMKKIPEIEESLRMVRFLKEKNESQESIDTNYELNETLYTTATIEPTDKVMLWLGADIMLEYPIDEAEELLVEKLSTAKTNLEISEEDAEFLRENITTMEVNTARLYNWDVERRKKERLAEEGAKNLRI